VVAGGGERTFEVVAWLSERGLVLYVPAIEASTTVPAMPEADAAVRSLIADLTGLDPSLIRCDIHSGRPHGISGPPSFS
jgi:hypothetical protein